MNNDIKIALLGNPNSGKTSVFNFLTGTNQIVANYPGVTVEKKEGFFNYNGYNINVIDLPGIYSFTAYSLDERVVQQYILNEKPDFLINVIDAGNLERNLYLTVQLIELGIPFIIDLNMYDMLEERKTRVDLEKFKEIFKTEIITTIGNKGTGIDDLKKAIIEFSLRKQNPGKINIRYNERILSSKRKIEDFLAENLDSGISVSTDWLSLKLLERDPYQMDYIASISKDSKKFADYMENLHNEFFSLYHERPEIAVANARYAFIAGAYHSFASSSGELEMTISDKIDHVVTHSALGVVILFIVLFTAYKLVFDLGEYPSELIQKAFNLIGDMIPRIISNDFLQSLIKDGVIAGMGGVLGFVPIIFLMFVFIAILEDSGYMARIAFLFDSLLRKFGLHGSSIISIIISGGITGGCAVPGVLATRIMRSDKERLATIAILPFFSCGAKLPVYAVIISAFFENQRALILIILTVLSWIIALSASLLIRKTILKGPSETFVIELPSYHIPTFRSVMQRTWLRTWMYIKKAGTIILLINIILWFLMRYPDLGKDRKEYYNSMRNNVSHVDEIKKLDNLEAQERLENSIAGRIGKFMVHAGRYIGSDFRMNIALIGGLAAKELILSTLSTAYSLGETDDESSIAEVFKDPMNGWNRLKAFSVLIFIMLYAPCFATLIIILKETGLRWMLFTFAYTTTIAYIISLMVYQGGLLLKSIF
ncbi:MAG: ferrous iron transport protein B [Candidatus Coatesbacteria bacterium]|nr:ferrous iron transport protein B [Candidatus Coatesbacteria bacterium]